MVIQKRKIETDQDRSGGFSTFNNQFSYFSSPQNNTGTIEQQTIDEQLYETQNNQVSYEEPSTTYDGESEYHATDMPSEEAEGEYAYVKTFMPNVEKRETTIFDAKPKTKLVQKTKIKLNARGKILACAYSVIVCLLIAFCVYNAVAISNVKNALQSAEVEYAQTLNEVSLLQSNYDELSSMSKIDQSTYTPVGEGNTVKVEIAKRPAFVHVEESTNWFDKICNFLSNLF